MDLDFDPATITLATFNTLLGAFETTVRQIARTKALLKSKSKLKSASNVKKMMKQTGKRAALSAKDAEEAQYEHAEDLDLVDAQVRDFLELDEWRYKALPDVVEKRRGGKDEGEGEGYLSKDELIRLTEWKLKHGVYRPTLLGMVRQNQDKTVSRATASAFSSLSSLAGSIETVETALSTLTTPLRGVGPATASLILSTASKDVPFYSDDVFLWLCVGVYPFHSSSTKTSKEVKPNGELNAKYNVAEYRRLWEGVQGLRERLNEGVEKGKEVSCSDVERVALVVRRFGQSGLGILQDDEAGEQDDEKEDPKESGGSGDGRRKRRRI
ncbi:uncharacterized protein DSM5745_06268 [Aspergillus mulundensis]|uniref:Uncharacterized protein n=1 Tax=Aspergillus mulundensis TaxID=1810919 RepID=A0A3D8RQR1_9EURO|nr:Uncharacterized protein DSM5745_06268 [Aspergillus mulundensis]RDW76276.1 Uncharacterized protein DSM5745_06268 [Aspergillus mulundensis]